MNYTIKEIKDWYDRVYLYNPKRFIRSWKSYNRFIQPMMPGLRKKLLDVACGTGGLLKAANERGLIPFGLDISREAILWAARVSGCNKLVVANGENLPYKDNSFEYVTNVGSLEHFPDPKAGLKEMIRVLKAEGKMCVVLPNSFGFFGKLIGFTGTGQIMERLATLGEWKSFLESEQVRITSMHRDLGPSVLHDKKPLKILVRLAAKLIMPFLPKSCTYQFIFICKKK
jgi:ubiquinone/menaquinone biosynthesis C-methylase UbiE